MYLEYQELKKEIEKIIQGKSGMVLSTSQNLKVTSRMISTVSDGLNVYFQTDKNFEKYDQMKSNNNVALCIDNIQIEGVSSELGHPLNEENKAFIKRYKEKQNSSYKNYSHLKDEVMFVIIPRKITLWKYLANKPCRDILFCYRSKAIREYYEG